MVNRLHIKNILLRNLAVLALAGSGIMLLGSALGTMVFDHDHFWAWLLGIENGRFLHHPQAVLCVICLVACSWWIKQLVSRLYMLKGEGNER